jgi:hypothetical protein
MKFSGNICAGLVAIGLAANIVGLQGAEAAPVPVVVFIPTTSAPTPPAGLNVSCMTNPSLGFQTSTTCPVVQFNGRSVWAFSYDDNRTALALVTYDAKGNIVNTISKPGTRYIWEAISGPKDKAVQFFGQANTWVTATWDELKLQ